MKWPFSRRRVQLPALEVSLPRFTEIGRTDVEKVLPPAPARGRAGPQKRDDAATGTAAQAFGPLIPEELRRERLALQPPPQLSGNAVAPPRRSRFQPNPTPDFELREVDCAKAATALRNFALCVSAPSDDGAAKWAENVSKASRALEEVFGTNLRMTSSITPCFAIVTLEKIRFVTAGTEGSAELGSLDLSGICANISLTIRDSELRSLYLYNAELLDLFLQGIDSGDSDAKYWDGVWIEARGLKIKDVLLITASPEAPNRQSHLSLLRLSRSTAKYCSITGTVMTVGDEAHQLMSRIMRRGLDDFEFQWRQAEKDNVKILEALRRIMRFGPWDQSYWSLAESLVVDYAHFDVLNLSCRNIGSASLMGNKIDSRLSITNARFIDPRSIRRLAMTPAKDAQPDIANPATYRPLAELIGLVDRLLEGLKASKVTDPALPSGDAELTASYTRLFQTIRDWLNVCEDGHWLPALSLRNTAIAGELELNNLGPDTEPKFYTGQSGPDEFTSAPQKATSKVVLDKIVGFVDFSSANCKVLMDDGEWWRGRQDDPSIHYDLTNFRYDAFAKLTDLRAIMQQQRASDRSDIDNLNAESQSQSQRFDTSSQGIRTILRERVEWLKAAAKQPAHAHQAFQAQHWTQLAATMRNMGWHQEADEVLFNRELRIRNGGDDGASAAWLPGVRTGLALISLVLLAALLSSGDIKWAGYFDPSKLNDRWPMPVFMASTGGAILWWLFGSIVPGAREAPKGLLNAAHRDLERFSNMLLAATIGYGYKPWRAAFTTALFVAAGTVVFYVGSSNLMSRPGPDIKVPAPQQSPVASLDATRVAAPMVDGNPAPVQGVSGPMAPKDPESCLAKCTAAQPYDECVLKCAVRQGVEEAFSNNKPAISEFVKSMGSEVEKGVTSGISSVASKSELPLNPFVFSFNRFFPFIDLSQSSDRVPGAYVENGEVKWLVFLLWCYYWFHTLAGLWVSTVIIAYVTGLLERRL